MRSRRTLRLAAVAVALASVASSLAGQGALPLSYEADRFGPLDGVGYENSVAVRGDEAAVGADGVVHVLRHDGARWRSVQELPSGLPDTGVRRTVVLGRDALVTATVPLGGGPGTPSGVVDVYARQGADWVLAQQLVAPSPPPGFGHALALSGDTLVVGSRIAGRAWIYRHDGSAWVLDVELTSPVGGNGWFGRAVAVSGRRVAIGARQTDCTVDPLAGTTSCDGAVFVFTRGAGGWSLEAELPADEPGMQLGSGVALDGPWLAAGGLLADTDAGADRGAVLVWRHGPGGWQRTQRLEAPGDWSTAAWFGDTVVLDGEQLVVGSPGSVVVGTQVGSAVVHRLEAGLFVPAWQLRSTGDGSGDAYGSVLACSDGRVLVAGLSYGANQPGTVGLHRSLDEGARWLQAGGGAEGGPRLSALGADLRAGPAHLRLAQAPARQPTLLVAGLSRADAPFLGGVVVPSPDLLLVGPVTTLGGAALVDLHGTLVPPGARVWLQWWVGDPASAGGARPSNALLFQTP